MDADSGTLLITRNLVAELATTRDYLAAMQTAFAGLAEGRYEFPTVGHIPANGGAFHIKSAIRSASPALVAVKVNGNFPGNSSLHGLPTIQGFIALLDSERGRVLALMDSIEITARRTAAATALAAQLLAKSDSEVLGMVGCGTQARYHLEALIDIAPIRVVQFHDLCTNAASSFERSVRALGLEAVRATSAGAAARDADIVVTLTTSTESVLALADIDRGTFVAGVGADSPSKHELSADLLRASRVVVDSLAQATAMGDLHHAVRSGVMTVGDVCGELADVVTRKVAGRTSNQDRVVFDSTGIAVQDLVAAEMIFERARLRNDVPRLLLNSLDR